MLKRESITDTVPKRVDMPEVFPLRIWDVLAKLTKDENLRKYYECPANHAEHLHLVTFPRVLDHIIEVAFSEPLVDRQDMADWINCKGYERTAIKWTNTIVKILIDTVE